MVDPRNTGTVAELLNAINPVLAERELQITIWPDGVARFEGSAAQLEAEGITAKGFKWLRAAAFVRWEANGFDYVLCRTRPQGWKGSKTTWFEVDNWTVNISVTGRDYFERNRLKLVRKSAELQAELQAECRRRTPAGLREWETKWSHYFDARDDKAFQAFKALIPGLIPPKRGRKAKTTTSGAAQ